MPLHTICNTFSDGELFNQQEHIPERHQVSDCESITGLRNDFCWFREGMEKRFERIENAQVAATRQRDQVLRLLQGLSDSVLFTLHGILLIYYKVFRTSSTSSFIIEYKSRLSTRLLIPHLMTFPLYRKRS